MFFPSSNHLLQDLFLFQLPDAERGFGEGAGLGDRHRAAARLADFAEGALRAHARETGAPTVTFSQECALLRPTAFV